MIEAYTVKLRGLTYLDIPEVCMKPNLCLKQILDKFSRCALEQDCHTTVFELSFWCLYHRIYHS